MLESTALLAVNQPRSRSARGPAVADSSDGIDSRETSAGPSASSVGPVGINAARPLPRPPLRSVITALLGSTASPPTSLFSHGVQPIPWLRPHNSSPLA